MESRPPLSRIQPTSRRSADRGVNRSSWGRGPSTSPTPIMSTSQRSNWRRPCTSTKTSSDNYNNERPSTTHTRKSHSRGSPRRHRNGGPALYQVPPQAPLVRRHLGGGERPLVGQEVLGRDQLAPRRADAGGCARPD